MKNHVHQEKARAEENSMDVYVTEDSELSKSSTVRKKRPISKSKKAKFSKRKKEWKTEQTPLSRRKPTSPSTNVEPPPSKRYKECSSIQVTSKSYLGQQQTISSRPSWSQEKLENSLSFQDTNKTTISKVEKTWLSLLERRPPSYDTPALCVWLDKVLSSSEEFEDIMKKTNI